MGIQFFVARGLCYYSPILSRPSQYSRYFFANIGNSQGIYQELRKALLLGRGLYPIIFSHQRKQYDKISIVFSAQAVRLSMVPSPVNR